jgi:hypothetical protein
LGLEAEAVLFTADRRPVMVAETLTLPRQHEARQQLGLGRPVGRLL